MVQRALIHLLQGRGPRHPPAKFKFVCKMELSLDNQQLLSTTRISLFRADMTHDRHRECRGLMQWPILSALEHYEYDRTSLGSGAMLVQAARQGGKT